MHLSILAGTTSKIVQIPVYDSSSTTGGMLTGLVFNTSSLVCWYNREGAAGSANQISLLTATKGTWTTAGFVAVDGTNMPGWYELHVPNAAVAAGAKSVSIELRGATNMVPVNILIELTATDNQDSVRGGMTALPNAAAAASGGLPVLGTNATAISFTAGMTISSTTGNALALTSSGGNGDGLAATGNGTGAGIHLVPGATGNGLLAVGGATSGTAIKATGTAGNAIALELAGQGSAAGLSATGGATGIGITAVGGATSGSGLKATGSAGNAIALEIVGQGSAAGIQATGGATGSAFKLIGGGTSGHGLAVTTTAGDGFNLTPTAGNAITATANGTSKHGIVATGGTAGTSDGASFIAGTGGVDFRAARTGALIGNITGNLSGSVGSVTGAVGSVTGAVGSVTGAVGSVTGAVGSVTARVTANTDQWAGTTIPAPAVTGVPKVDLVDIAGVTVSTSTAQLGVNAVQIGAAVPGSATIGTVTTTTTATNLTNAPTSGDLTSTMKTSVENAVWDAARSSHLATGVFGQMGQEILRDNTATAGASSTITLDAGASTTVDQYKGDVLYIYSGTGSGQSRVISAYSAGRVATIVPAWVTTPDNTSKFILTAQRTPLVGTDTRILTSADVSTSGETVAAVTGAVGSVTGAVGSVTGSVGSVTGAVGSVTADVGITQAGADKVWSTTTRALTDKIGFALSSAGVQAIWDALTSAMTTVGSIGKLLVTDIDGTISSRSTYAGGDTSGTTTLLSRLTGTRATNLDNLDAAISSRSVFASGVDTVTVGTNNDKTGYRLSATGIDDVWDEVTSGHTTAGTTGKALIDAGAAGDPWGAALPGSYGAGTAGAILGTNLDATVSSRSAYAGGDTSGTTTILSRLTSTRAGNLDNLDVAITTRLASAGYTAPDNSDIAAIKAKTDNLPASPAAVSDIPTASANASATWDAVRASHTTSGTFGQGVSSVQGNVTGSAASVTADVGITQAGADKAWSTATRALTDKSGFALTSAYDPAKTAAQTGDAMALTTGERDSVAEAALKLDWTGIVGEASRSTLNALRFLRNKWSFTGTTLTVTAEDDTTSAWTGEVTTSSSAQPITGVDPT